MPLAHQGEGIRWLILEDDVENTGGWYLYGHKDLDGGAIFDSWHPTRSEVLQEAANR
jgi:hypothetical protein